MNDNERAQALWAKLCTDCAHEPRGERCDCLDDIMALIREVREDQKADMLKLGEWLRS